MKSDERIRFGLVPDDREEATLESLAVLCRHLAERIQSPLESIVIESIVFESPAELAAAFGSQEIQMAWSSPTLTLTAPGMAEAIPLVSSVRDGVTVYHGVLFCDSESPLRSIVELKGTHVAWVAPSSAAGYIFPRLALASHGIDPRTLFAIEAFHDSHGNVARAVLQRHADVGATYAAFEGGDPTSALRRAGFVDVVEGRSGRILFATPAIPSDLIVVHPDVTASSRAALIGALVELTQNAEAAAALKLVLGADGFAPFEPGALDPLRNHVSDGRELGLLEL